MSDPTNPIDVNIDEIGTEFTKVISEIGWGTWGAAALYIIFGFLIASFARSLTGRLLARYTSEHYTQIIRRVVYYTIIIISVLLALSTLQLNMKVLGIATVLTLAIGFASQTAVSNIITGIFLVFEKPFKVGDHLEINNTIGELLSIDLMSIKIRTFENSQLRIPNEVLLKTEFINLTRFPIRRLDTTLRIDLQADLDKVKKVLFDLARKNPLALESPHAQLLFEEFNESAIVFKFAVWVKRESYYTLKHSLPLEIQKAFKEQDIKLPGMQIHLEKSS